MLKTMYTDGGKEQAGFTHERNDCAVRALALATGIPYAKAHDLLKSEGRKDRRGTKTAMSERALLKTGATVEKVIVGVPCGTAWMRPQYPTLADVVRRYRTGRYHLIVRGHALAMIDGVIHDAGDISGPRCRVRHIHRITFKAPVSSTLSQEDINSMWARLEKLKF